MTQNSPFLIYQDFLSAPECETLAAKTFIDTKTATSTYQPDFEKSLFEKFLTLAPEFEERYQGFKYKGTEKLLFQQFPPMTTASSEIFAEKPHCENAVYKRKRWMRINNRDLTGILWLKDYQESPPFNHDLHVLGGKLEFPVYNFGFQAQRGTLVVYPANERFISHTTSVLVGNLQCIRFHVHGDGTWFYNPENFQGDYRDWFANIV